MASQAPSDLLTVEQATILPQLDPFQQFTAAYKNIPKSGRLLGALQVIQGQSRYEDKSDDYNEDDPQAFLLERKDDAEIYSALSDLIKTNFCCGGEISLAFPKVESKRKVFGRRTCYWTPSSTIAVPKPEPAIAEEPHTTETPQKDEHDDDSSEEAPELEYVDGNAESVQFKTFCLDDAQLQSLVEMAQPAPYGDLKQGRTQYDPSVRTALELPLVENATSLGSTESLIRALIGKHLIPDRNFYLKPYKLNIYREGDFFKRHVDTPRSAEMIGTLVVALPVAHQGGDLIIRHHGHEMKFQSAQTSEDESRLRWTAFYGDCEHEVLPVTSGHRVTLTFMINVRETEPEQVPNFSVRTLATTNLSFSVFEGRYPVENVKKVQEKFRNLLSNRNTVWGILLAHRYNEGGLRKRLLKGIDMALYKIISEMLGYSVELLPVLVHENWEYGENEYLDETRPGGDSANVFSFTQNDIAFFSHPSNTLEELPVEAKGTIRFAELSLGDNLVHIVNGGSDSGNGYEMGFVDGIYMASAMVIKPKKVSGK